MRFLFGVLLIIGPPLIVGLIRSNNKSETAKEYLQGAGRFARIVGTVAAFVAGCAAGLLKWGKSKK